eukprot:1188573-Prorocentrum_minimum.AAC.3
MEPCNTWAEISSAANCLERAGQSILTLPLESETTCITAYVSEGCRLIKRNRPPPRESRDFRRIGRQLKTPVRCCLLTTKKEEVSSKRRGGLVPSTQYLAALV